MADPTSFAELFGVVVGGAIATLGGHRGISWVVEKRNGKKNGGNGVCPMHVGLERKIDCMDKKIDKLGTDVAFLRGLASRGGKE